MSKTSLFTSVSSVRRISTSSLRSGKTKQTAKEQRKKSNCDRALDHFDDFYGTFFGRKKWPSLRLGLLCPPKYIAIPNPYTGNLDQIATKLESIGAYNLHKLWEESRKELAKERKEFDNKKDLGRIHSLEKTLESIAVTKKAEEMDMIYGGEKLAAQGVGAGLRESDERRMQQSQRVFSHPSQAAFMPPSRLKGVGEFAFDSDYYSGFLPGSLNTLLDPDDDHPFVYSNPGKTVSPKWPLMLRPYTFETGSGQEFPAASRDSTTGFREYICVNGASLAPVLALDLNPSVDMLDVCAGPGTKSLMAMMTMSLGSITCNDIETLRLHRIKNIFHEFLGTQTPEQVTYTRCSGMRYPSEKGDKKFDRVLADVPCLNDRTSCTIPDNNIFKTTRTKERLSLVKNQKLILLSSLRTMSEKEGSVTVYSTCTLSPVENDGVVMQALKESQVPNLCIDLYGLLSILKPFERNGIFKLVRTRLGVLIQPCIESNFGPMFVSRIIVQKQVDSDSTQINNGDGANDHDNDRFDTNVDESDRDRIKN